MLENFFTVAVRNLLKQRFFSFINVIGLAIGIACAIFIFLFIQYELSYDKHFANADRIYRVTTVLGSYETKDSPLPLAHTLQDQFPEVEKVARLAWMEPPSPYFLTADEKGFQEDQAFYGDSSVFGLFGIDLLEGNSQTALVGPQSLTLSESTAHRYFGNSSALGKTIRFNNQTELKVTGVFPDFPSNSHIHPAIIVSSLGNKMMQDNSAKNWEYLYTNSTYFLLSNKSPIDAISRRVKNLFWTSTSNTREAYGTNYDLFLQRLTDIHLQSHYPGETNGSYTVLYTFGAIGLVILVIAAINFMNLSTVRSQSRAREVGIRKVMGSQRVTLIIQFLIESIATVILATMVALAICFTCIGAFNDLLNIQLSLQTILTLQNIVILILFVILLGIVSGLYPAFFLSGYKPALVLKGKFSMNKGSINLRKTLVITQFAIAFVVVASTLIIRNQLHFMLHKDLGYQRDQVMTINLPNDSIGVDRVRDEMARLPFVVAASKMSESFDDVQMWGIPWFEGAPPQNDFSVTRLYTDSDFAKVANLKMAAGRFFNQNFMSDSLSYVINETAARRLGWKNEEAIGKRFGSQENPGKVVGVVKDFHYRHLSTPIASFVFFPPGKKRDRYERGRIAIQFEPTHLKQVLAATEQKWNELVAKWPFKYSFLRENIEQQYQGEIQLSRLTHVFSILAIVVSILGLFGLVSFSINQRVKEIGIRKVLGAEIKNLVFLATKDFVKLVSAGILVGMPVAYIASVQWLATYAYRAEFSWLPYLMAFVCCFIAAVATIIPVALKASASNPAKSLRQD